MSDRLVWLVGSLVPRSTDTHSTPGLLGRRGYIRATAVADVAALLAICRHRRSGVGVLANITSERDPNFYTYRREVREKKSTSSSTRARPAQ